MELEIDLENMDIEKKWEFYELAYLSIEESYNDLEDEALICEIEDDTEESDEHANSSYIFLSKDQWFDFLEDAKKFFITVEEFDTCAAIAVLQSKIRIPNILESLIISKNN